MIVGIWRYARKGAFEDRIPLQITVTPMGIGSAIGAIIGGLLVGYVSQKILKLLLGIILIVSAIRVFSHTRKK